MDSLIVSGAKFSFSQTLKTNFVKNLSKTILQESGFENSSFKKLLENVEENYEKLPKIAKNSLKTFATFHALFFLKDMIGARPITTSSKEDYSRFGNLFYDRNIEIFDLFASSLISSTALGFLSLISEKISDQIFEARNASSQTNSIILSTSISSTNSSSSSSSSSESPSPIANLVFTNEVNLSSTSSTANSLKPSNSPKSEVFKQLYSVHEKGNSVLWGCA
jgi:hypothetical protein